MEIGELTEKFEQEAKTKGYQLMAICSYNPETDRHQITWNDTAPMEIRNPALEGLALCFLEMADEDPDLIIGAIRRASFHTKKGHEYWVNVISPIVEKCFNTGIELGKALVKEKEEDQKTLDIGEWTNEE